MLGNFSVCQSGILIVPLILNREIQLHTVCLSLIQTVEICGATSKYDFFITMIILAKNQIKNQIMIIFDLKLLIHFLSESIWMARNHFWSFSTEHYFFSKLLVFYPKIIFGQKHPRNPPKTNLDSRSILDWNDFFDKKITIFDQIQIFEIFWEFILKKYFSFNMAITYWQWIQFEGVRLTWRNKANC